ncbi:hypothetical protein P5704_023930 (plasmid) [Pseudomonas sp. FeN3W]|nr:hypothetical protein P5704_023930 [Pseudomonas sp. FeN3W]
MTTPQAIDQKLLDSLAQKHPFFRSYQFNEFGAPHLKGGSPVDLGMYLLFIQELERDANCVNLSSILSVSELTCKNWITKLREECVCDIDWHSQLRVGRSFQVKSTGIFSIELYEEFKEYVKLVIHNWRAEQCRTI